MPEYNSEYTSIRRWTERKIGVRMLTEVGIEMVCPEY
jgi:hypothetical protein